MSRTISTPPTDAQSIDSAHALLGDALRRAVVEVVTEREPPIDLTDLARTIAERDADRTGREIAISLHHVHLPKLNHATVIDYDAATRTVRAARPEVLLPFVDQSDGNG